MSTATIDPAIAPAANPAFDPIGAGEDPVFTIDFRAIAFLIRRNLVAIALIVLAALVLGFAATMLITPRYVATSRLQIDQVADRILDDRNSVQPEVAIQDADRFLNTQVDVLTSRTMAVRVMRSLNLLASKAFFDQMRVSVPAPDTRVAPAKAMEEEVIKILADNTKVDLPRESRVVSVSFDSPDPDLAARVANAYAREFIASNLQRKFNSSAYAREFLAGELANAKNRLEASERTLNDYARSAGLIRTDSSNTDEAGRSRPGQSITSAGLLQVNEAALVARADRIAAEGKWRAAANTNVLILPEVLSNPAVQNLQGQRGVIEGQLRQERAVHLDGHPNVKRLTEQLAAVDSQLNTLAGRIKQSINEQYRAAVARERQLAGQVSQFKAVQLNEQQLGVRYGILAREADTNRTLYDGLLQRYKEVGAAAGVSTNNVSVVDDATVPIKPSSPRLLVNLALALLTGLGCAAAYVMVREQLDDVIRVPDDVERKLHLPVLGSIPEQDDAFTIPERLDQPQSALSEAYNALRTSMLYATTHGLPRSISVASTVAGEGKTTTSYALARGFGKLGKRVVLISADLRRPSLHKMLGLENDHGLTDALTTTGSVEKLIVPTADDGLYFMPSGPIPPNPTELLGSARMREVVGELGGQFDVVVIDGPPVLGLADAPLLAVVAEATIFVIESDRGSHGANKSALRRLRSSRANVIGAVLTKLNARKVGQNYGYYDYEYYAYGEYVTTPQGAPARGLFRK